MLTEMLAKVWLQCWDWEILTKYSNKYTKFWQLFKRNSNLILIQKSNFHRNYVAIFLNPIADKGGE